MHHEKFQTRFIIKILATLSAVVPKNIIYCSEHAKEVHESIGYNTLKSIVIYNGIDTSRFYPSKALRHKFRDEMGIDEGIKVVGIIARYIPIKGFNVFLKMAKNLIDTKKEIRFIMAGTAVTEENQELLDMIKELNLLDYCIMLGERSDIESIMNGLDILVSTSYSESFGLILIEALSCGKPVVSSDLPEPRYIVGEDYVIPPGMSELFAKKVMGLLNATPDELKTIGIHGRERVLKYFNDRLMIESYRNAYMNTILV